MRIFVIMIVLSSGMAGCFGSDELFEEQRGIGVALRSPVQDDKFEKMKIHFCTKKGMIRLQWIW